MPTCKKCKIAVVRGKDQTVKCKKECGAVFHLKCSQEVNSFRNSEICEDCLQKQVKGTKTESHKINLDLSKVSPDVLLAEVNRKLDIIVQLQETINGLVSDVAFYAEHYQKLVDSQKSTETKIKALEQKNVFLEKSNKALEERVTSLEYSCKQKSIEIVGLDCETDEHLKTCITAIAAKLELNYEDICKIETVGAQIPTAEREGNVKKRPRPVRLHLSTSGAKMSWLEKGKKEKLKNCDIRQGGSDNRIFINDDLPKRTRQLLWETKKDLKNKFKFIWVHEGRILVRKDDRPENKKIYVIRSEDPLVAFVG
ncbi:hypothetical protein O0L34_g11765 [Tuta absoluta]|nr:hypothetical protein O0L34_g11765 [Tuta absoluta]